MNRRDLLKSAVSAVTFANVLPRLVLAQDFPEPHSMQCVCGAQFNSFDADLPPWLGKIRFTGWKGDQATVELAAQWFTVSPMADGQYLYASVSHYPMAGTISRGQRMNLSGENPFSLLADNSQNLAALAQKRIKLALIRLLGMCVEYHHSPGREDEIRAIIASLSQEV